MRLTSSPCTLGQNQPSFSPLPYLDRLGVDALLATRWYGWVVLLVSIFAGVVAGKVAATVLKQFSASARSRGWGFRAVLLASAAGPANLALISLGLGFGLTWLVMDPPLRDLSLRILAFLYVLAIAWFAYNLGELVDVTLRHMATCTASKLDDQMVPLIRKTLRIFIIVVFALFVAENIFGADIGAWLAGLGIAGLAVSLAAQDSIKNLFGSVTIFMDRPFGVGDVISFSGQLGTVEEIGFRSTRMRTFVGTLVTIPNSKIVDSSVENVSSRGSIRRTLNVTITYDTPPEKIEQAIETIRQILADPDVASAFDLEKTPPRVSFDELNADSLNIKVNYWFHPPDYWQYLDHCQVFNLKLMRAFAAAGIEFAFPTRTLYLAGDPKRRLALDVHTDDAAAAAAPGNGQRHTSDGVAE